MAEYIKRDDVIKVLRRYSLSNGASLGKHSGAVDCAIDDVEKIQAAVDVKSRADWITKEPLPRTYGRPRAMCGRCGAFALYEMVNAGAYAEQLTAFCPSCGAKMSSKE